jgi:hypothetical protein
LIIENGWFFILNLYKQAEWLEWSGLPEELNRLRAHGWVVFKKLVELDCEASRRPGRVEISVSDLAIRCGLENDKTARIIDILRKKQYLRCFRPEEHAEPALIEIRLPVRTPRSPEEVARECPDPLLKSAGMFRYATAPSEIDADERRTQEVIDLYMDRISMKMNSFILEQIEITAGRFPMEKIRYHIERAASHDIHEFGWVLKELIRDERSKPGEK